MAANQNDKPESGTTHTPTSAKTKTKSMDSLVFRRRERAPSTVLSSADFWFDRFTTYHEIILFAHVDGADGDIESLNGHNAELLAEWAVTQADAALNAYESRWPGIEPPSA